MQAGLMKKKLTFREVFFWTYISIWLTILFVKHDSRHGNFIRAAAEDPMRIVFSLIECDGGCNTTFLRLVGIEQGMGTAEAGAEAKRRSDDLDGMT